MRIAVMGAGAVGCYYGAMLARAGHAVTLIGRAPLVEAVQAQGLRLESAAFDGVVALQASTDAAAAAEWNLPASWKLRAQMPFGSHEAEIGGKDFIDDAQRFRVFG